MPNSCGSKPRALIVLLAASTFALGCSVFAPPFHLSDGAPMGSDFDRLVLLPMNFDHSPRPALAPGVELVGERIRSYLEATGYEVVVPRMSATLALWQECAAHVGGIADESGKELDGERYERARSELVRRTLESIPADGVIAATVMVRKGRYFGKTLRWDGVARPVSIDMGNTNRSIHSLRGKGEGTSLRTSIFDREGGKLFERYVGLEPIHRHQVVYPVWRPSNGRISFRTRR